jgi:radical SAM protein with 4Fe4S-binding SPASM domain
MGIFKKIYIEVTNCCNLSCSFCHQSRRPKAFMNAVDFADVLEKIKGHTRFIYLHVLGEAMLHPEFERLLGISHRAGLQVNLSTNGTLLNRSRGAILASPAVRQVNVSLHSHSPSDGPAMEEYLSEILSFSRAARERSIWFNLRLWDIQDMRDHRDEGKHHAGSSAGQIGRHLQAAFSLPAQFFTDLAPGESRTLAPGLFLSRERQFTWPHAATSESGDRGTCRGLRDHIAILVDGTVVPCCLDAEADIALGNIHRQGLEKILGSPRASRMREGLRNQQLIEALCRRCDYRLRFLPKS